MELYERMFNGGLHNWDVKAVSMTNDSGSRVNALIGQSSPTNTDVSGAKVVFTQNAAYRFDDQFTVSGGAIGCNGLLVMGTKAELKILKVWEDNGDNDGYRPTKEEYKKLIEDGKLAIKDGQGNTVNLAADGLQIDVVDAKDYDLSSNVATGDDDTEALQKLVDEKDTYLIVISGLEPGDYQVVSDQVESYTFSVSTDSKRVLVNKHVDDQVKISVEKKWDDASDQDGIRPTSVTVKLLADGTEVEGKTLTLSADNEWKGEFTDLPKFKEQKEIEYTLSEDTVEGYTVEYSVSKRDNEYKNRKDYNEVASEELDNDKIEEVDEPVAMVTVLEGTVTNKHTPGTTTVSVAKEWDDASDQDGIRPTSVTVKLLADGAEVEGKTLTLSEDNGWKGSFADLPKLKDGKEIAYTVEEAPVEGYESKVAGSAQEGFKITNTHTPEEEPAPQKAKATIKATKSMGDGTTLPADTFEFVLTSDGDNPAGDPVDGQVRAKAAADGAVSFGEFEFPAVEKDTTFTYFMHEEDPGQGYTSDGLTHVVQVTVTSDGKSEVVYDQDPQASVAFVNITNDHPNRYNTATPVELAAKKTVNGQVPDDATFTFQIDKVSDDVPNASLFPVKATNDSKGNIVFDKNAFMFTEADAGNTYKYRITEVNDGQAGYNYDSATYDVTMFVYYVEEEKAVYAAVDVEKGGASVKVDEIAFVNTTDDTVTETSISVEKVWDDEDDADGIRPDSITINLLANDEKSQSVELSAANGWKHTFANLPGTADDGTQIDYSLEEVAVEGYEGSQMASSYATYDPDTGVTETGASYTFVNKHSTEKVTGKKVNKGTTPKAAAPRTTVRTSDEATLALPAALLLVSAGALAAAGARRRRA